MTDLNTLCPKDERVWMTYYNRQNELLFFLASPAASTSSMAAQTGAFSLYAVTAGPRGAQKAKKLGQGSNPTELETKFRVAEKICA